MKRFRAAAFMAGSAVAALVCMSTATPARATVQDYPNSLADEWPTANFTSVHLYAVIDNDHQAAYASVYAGLGTVQARAQCQRGDGRTAWYQSTINASTGSTSHYDCDNNGTYNRAVVGLGADIQ